MGRCACFNSYANAKRKPQVLERRFDILFVGYWLSKFRKTLDIEDKITNVTIGDNTSLQYNLVKLLTKKTTTLTYY